MFIGIAADPRASWKSSPTFQLEPPGSRLMHGSRIFVRQSGLLQGRGNFCSIHSWFRGRKASALELPGCKGSEHQKVSEAFGSMRGCGPSSKAPGSGRFPGHHARSHGRICWEAGRPRSQGKPHPFQHRAVQVLRAASRKSGSPALQEARTPLGAVLASVASDSPSNSFVERGPLWPWAWLPRWPWWAPVGLEELEGPALGGPSGPGGPLARCVRVGLMCVRAGCGCAGCACAGCLFQ